MKKIRVRLMVIGFLGMISYLLFMLFAVLSATQITKYFVYHTSVPNLLL